MPSEPLPSEHRTACCGELADKQAIHEVLLRYCRAIDRCDADLLRSVYHHDSFDDHGKFRGNGQDFAAWAIAGLLAVEQRTTHVLSNVLIDLDGDSAACESYCVGTHVRDLGDHDRVTEFHCRYVDRFEKRGSEWAIAHRVVVYDWSAQRDVRPAHRRADRRLTHGRRSAADPVYARSREQRS